ncbi:MAG: protein kinase [Ruminococcus sp.]|nr:protein kinase [Ruminococcus sp.]
MLEIGDRLKSYEPLWENWYKDSYLGGGNFGKVYKLKQDFLGVVTYSAVKIISINLESEMVAKDRRQSYIEERKRFVAEEIKNMYKLKGRSNLVHCLAHSIRDVYDDNGDLVGFDVLIRMDFYRALPDYLKHNGALDQNSVEKLAYQIGMALESMHDINMLHRDIKPDNIYMDEKNVFYLGDFGVSKQVDSSSYSTLAGTQPFIAPEVWQVTKSNKNYSKTADIYSYGITLYYLLNENRLPLVTAESNLNQIEQAIYDRLNGKPFPPPMHGSEKLKAVVMKCCEYRPEDRFQSMGEVLAALRNEGFRYTQKPVAPQMQDMAQKTMYAGAQTGASFSGQQPLYGGTPAQPAQPRSIRPPVQPAAPSMAPIPSNPSIPQNTYGSMPTTGYAQPAPVGPAAAPAAKKGSKKGILIAAIVALVAAIGVACAIFIPKLLGGAKEYKFDGTVNYDGDNNYSTFKVDSDKLAYIPDKYFTGYDEDGCSITLKLDTADVEAFNVYKQYLISVLEYDADDNLYATSSDYIAGVPKKEEEGATLYLIDFAEHCYLDENGVFVVDMSNTGKITFNLSAKCVKKLLKSSNKGLAFQCYGVNITEITIDAAKKTNSDGFINQSF